MGWELLTMEEKHKEIRELMILKDKYYSCAQEFDLNEKMLEIIINNRSIDILPYVYKDDTFIIWLMYKINTEDSCLDIFRHGIYWDFNDNTIDQDQAYHIIAPLLVDLITEYGLIRAPQWNFPEETIVKIEDKWGSKELHRDWVVYQQYGISIREDSKYVYFELV